MVIRRIKIAPYNTQKNFLIVITDSLDGAFQ